jgi:fucokinase
MAPSDRTLWDAQLYPVAADREASLDAVLWLPTPADVDPQALAAWRSLPRLSLAQSYAAADVPRIIQDDNDIQDRVRVQRFLAGVQQERPAGELATHLTSRSAANRRYRLAADSLEEALDPWLPIRGYRALEVASRDPRWGDRAFSALARLVRAHTPHNGHVACTLANPVGDQPEAEVRAAARLDFGGGWTDTPPYCLERGGAVLNAAIEIDGALPIAASAARTIEPFIALANRDIDVTIRPQYAGDILNFASPNDPFALHKAALVFRGVIPTDTPAGTPIEALCRRYGSGLQLTTATGIPRGSGLGTSSILAGTILKALGRVLGQITTDDLLFDEVLCVEQMITTGGGWQDQIGGLLPGIKLLTSTPGLPQRVTVQPVPLSDAFRCAFNERLMLIYTGQRRLAKDLLRRIMGRWMAREPEMVSCMDDLARLACEMRTALLGEDLALFGQLLTAHWGVLKRIDPGCTNPFIDDLWVALAPFISGGKLAGAGGGGFALVMLRDPGARATLAQMLAARYPDQAVSPWPCAISTIGLSEECPS